MTTTESAEHARCRQRTTDERIGIYRAEQRRRPDEELHRNQCHPDWEYAITEGPRKAWDYADVPPEGDGWVRNRHAGYPGEGWERFDYTEESYWMRPRQP